MCEGCLQLGRHDEGEEAEDGEGEAQHQGDGGGGHPQQRGHQPRGAGARQQDAWVEDAFRPFHWYTVGKLGQKRANVCVYRPEHLCLSVSQHRPGPPPSPGCPPGRQPVLLLVRPGWPRNGSLEQSK